MKHVIIAFLITTLSPVLLYANKTNVKAAAQIPNEMNVRVIGMVCSFCAQGIEKKFKAQKEVQEVQVSLEQKFVKIKFKDGMSLTQDQVKKIIKDAGYEVEFPKP